MDYAPAVFLYAFSRRDGIFVKMRYITDALLMSRVMAHLVPYGSPIRLVWLLGRVGKRAEIYWYVVELTRTSGLHHTIRYW